MGVVHHTVYPVWFEMGRTELLRNQGGSYKEIERDGLFFVVVDLHVQYKKPAKYDELITLETSIDSNTPARIHYSYALQKDGVVIATATTTLACVNKEGAVQRFPESFM